MHTTPDEYVFEVRTGDFPIRSVHVDRYDFNTKSIITYDIFGEKDTAVSMDSYRSINGSVFPNRITFSRFREAVEVHLQLGRPVFNRDIPEQTFLSRDVPSGWKHVDLDRQSQFFPGIRYDPVPE